MLELLSAGLLGASLQGLPPAQEVVGGEPSAPGAWPAVVAVRANGQLCTGTLIESDLVLTAAHCFRSTQAQTVEIVLGNDGAAPDRLDAAEVILHPDFCGDSNCGDDAFDFAVVRLADPVEDVEPLPLVLDQATWDLAMQPGAAFPIVGFGNDGNGEFETKREAVIPLSRFSAGGLQFWGGGEGPDSCDGDSGGPLLLRLDGVWTVVGVLSSGSDPCGAGGWYGVPHAAIEWLSDATGFEQTDACYELGCVDTSPPEDKGCGCSSTPRNSAPLGAIGLLLAALGRRRRGLV